MRQQIQSVSVEHETLKKSLNANDVARELDDTEKRLKHYERSIFELKDFVDTKSRETDYGIVFHLYPLCTVSVCVLVIRMQIIYFRILSWVIDPLIINVDAVKAASLKLTELMNSVNVKVNNFSHNGAQAKGGW